MWWWIPVGLGIWCLASVLVGLLVGPVLYRLRMARERQDQLQWADTVEDVRALPGILTDDAEEG